MHPPFRTTIVVTQSGIFNSIKMGRTKMKNIFPLKLWLLSNIYVCLYIIIVFAHNYLYYIQDHYQSLRQRQLCRCSRIDLHAESRLRSRSNTPLPRPTVWGSFSPLHQIQNFSHRNKKGYFIFFPITQIVLIQSYITHFETVPHLITMRRPTFCQKQFYI